MPERGVLNNDREKPFLINMGQMGGSKIFFTVLE